MTELDHRSPATLVSNLYLHRAGLFRFEWPDGNNALSPWRFVSVTIEDAYRFRLCAEHLSAPGAIVYDCWLSHLALHLTALAGLWVIVSLPPSEDDLPHDPDALVRQRLDKNLRGVFS